jgi:CheY-like chemotaxis protein
MTKEADLLARLVPRPAQEGVSLMDHELAVLLMADNEDEREMYLTGLGVEGFAVMCSGTDTSPAETAKQLEPSAVILVLQRADDRDWNLARAIPDDPRTRDIPVVLVTAALRADDASHRIARHLGNCAALVAKPCDPQALATIVRRVISGERNIATRCQANRADVNDRDGG